VVSPNPADLLTLDGPIDEAVTPTGLSKVGLGRLVLNNNANNYSGVTTVFAGALRVQKGGALGTAGSGTVVKVSAALELDGGSGISVADEGLTLSGTGLAQVQGVTVAGTSGTLTLTFKGSSASLPFNAPASQVQSALNNLASIKAGGGSVTVVQSGNVYYVAFQGALAAASQPLLTVAGTAKASVASVVGFGTGALHNVSGANTWSGAGNVLLPSGPSGANPPVVVATDPGTTLTIGSTIEDATAAGVAVAAGTGVPAPAALTKVGTGTLVLTAGNSYTGQTIVNEGALNVQNGGALGGTVSDVQRVTLGGPLTGSFTLTFNAKTTGPLSANTGRATFDSDVQTALEGLSTIGTGNVKVTHAGSVITITFQGALANAHQSQITGTGSGSTTVKTATIQDGSWGTTVASGASLQLQGGITVSGELLTVNGAGLNGAGALENVAGNNTWDSVLTLGSTSSVGVDVKGDTLTIDRAITDAGKALGVTKVGPGRLELDAVNVYTGPTTIRAGDVQVGGSVGGVLLAGGSLSGTGKAGTVGGAPAAGTVDPGDNGAASPVGTLHTQSAAFSPGTTFFVDLTHTSSGAPVAGTDNDLLIVNGNVALGGATLAGTVDPSVQLGDSFTVLQATGTISGKFAQPLAGQNVVFIAGNEFAVQYNLHSVVLTRVPTQTVTAVKSSANPAVWGQAVMFTATVSVPGGSGSPLGGTVTFYDDTGTAVGKGTVLDANEPLSSGQATSVFVSTLSVGPHTIDAVYSGDGATFGASSGRLTQTVNRASTTTTVSSSGSAATTFGDSVTFTATVSPKAPGAGSPTGSVSFFVDGSTTAAQTVTLSGGQATFTTTSLGASAAGHTVKAVYNGDGHFNTSSGTATQTVQQAGTTTALASDSGGADTVFGQAVTFTATVSTGASGSPTGTVSFFVDGSATAAAIVKLQGGQAFFKTATLSAGATAHTVQAVYSGDANFTGSSSGTVSQTVDADDTTTTVTSSKSTSGLGESVTFTATVKANAPDGGTPAGSVSFFVDGSATAAATVNLSGGQASFTTNSLDKGTHTISAVYTSTSGNFNGSTSADFTQTVLNASRTAIKTSASPSLRGATVTFTATVTLVAAGPAPTGTVTFLVDGVAVSGALGIDGNGQATFSTAALSAGNHTVTASYGGDVATAGGSGSLTQVVQVVTHLTASMSVAQPQVGALFSVSAAALGPSGLVTALNGVATIAAVGGPPGGGLAGPATARVVNGLVTFANLSVTVIGTYRLRVTILGVFIDLVFTTTGGRQT
jgi:autotransporter-associated beta strand protein